MIGYLRKIAWIFSILFFLFLISSQHSLAQESLSTTSQFAHNIKDNSTIETTITLTITGQPQTVLTYFNITIPQQNLDPEIYSITKNKKLEATISSRKDSTDLLINMDNSVIPNEGKISITLSYTQRYNDKSSISLMSKVSDTPVSEVTIYYPQKWGETSWVSDLFEDIQKEGSNYKLIIPKPNANVIKLIFGEEIIYNFQISKSLNNPTDDANQYEVIIPQDTQFQKIIIDSINIQPTQAITDNSNNYILIFNLDPNSQVDLKISGYMIMDKHEFYGPNFSSEYNQEDIYWNLEPKQIKSVEEFLADNNIDEQSSPDVILEYLYRYVIDTLKPAVERTSLAGGVRRGAMGVLKSPSESTPEDYADLLKTLLSLYEIPCIYSIGYVSDISNYQDDGMFHYWLQVHDGTDWKILDPYLEDFSKVSLFNRDQPDHITILNRTDDSISPVLTYYSDNDIIFEFINDSDVFYNPECNVSVSLEPYSILNKYTYGKINLENVGNTVFTGFDFTNSQPDISKYIDSVTNSKNTILLPHMRTDINFHIPFNDLDEDVIYSTVDIKNGEKSVASELISTEYSISVRTGYEVSIKIISFIIFLLSFGLIYILIEKFVYKK